MNEFKVILVCQKSRKYGMMFQKHTLICKEL